MAKTLSDATGLPYHLGRLTTYGVFGFTAVLLSKQIAATHWWPFFTFLMLAGAGLLFLYSFIRSYAEPSLTAYPRLTYLRGLLLGFMPCGLLYAALMMAATLANPLSGMLAMWIFTIGTIPALLIASGSAEVLGRHWQGIMQHAGRAMMAFNGVSLLVMAARIMR